MLPNFVRPQSPRSRRSSSSAAGENRPGRFRPMLEVLESRLTPTNAPILDINGSANIVDENPEADTEVGLTA